MKHCILLITALLGFFMPALSQNSPFETLGKLTEWKAEPSGLSLKTPTGSLRAVVYSPTIVRVRIAKEGRWDDHSFAVIANPQNGVKFTTKENTESLTLSTDALDMIITKNPVRVRFLTKQGKVINEDEPAFGTAWQGREVTTYKKLIPDEKFIGLGEKIGGLNRRGNAYTNWNTDDPSYFRGSDPMYGSHPFYIGLHSGSLMYGIFLDNSYKTHFSFGASTERYSSFAAEDGEMNYYFIFRPTVGQIIEDYTYLTGRMELPPIWALGYHQCRYSYFPDKEVMNLARTIRDKQIPADVIWFDIHYMDAYKVFTWHPERFPKPKQMLAELEGMGFKNVVITDPGIKVEKGYAAYEDGVKNDIFLKYPDGVLYRGDVWPGSCHFPDFTKAASRAWWGDKCKSLIDDGIDGFWTDMNEPAAWGQSIPHMLEFDFDSSPFESNAANNKATYKKGHNVFGMQMARATFEGSKKHSGKRPFVLTRASYAGIQRYAAIWTGDNTATDDHMMLGVRLLTSMGLSGIPFTGVDVGGFNGGATRELFARWMTIGALSPFFRVHAAINTKEQDPWSFGEDVEEICKNYIELRYRLMPYLYSAFYEASQTGMPVARSLAFSHPFDENIYNDHYHTQYMFGGSLLVAPVDSRQKFGKVYLPEGEWYDAHSDKALSGKQEVVVEAPLERLPMFVKGGSMIPMQSVVQFAAQKTDGILYLHVYNDKSGKKSIFTYYEDDGETYKYQTKDFAKREMSFESAQKKIILASVEGNRTSKFTSITFIFHGFEALPPEISVGGKKMALSQDSNKEATTLFKPLAGYDPLGSQAQTTRGANKKFITIPNTTEMIKIEW